MSYVEIKTVPVDRYKIHERVTTGDTIMNRTRVDVYPTQRVNFSFKGNNKIVFNFSSLDAFLMSGYMYFKASFYNRNVAVTGERFRMDGGVMSLFKRMTLYAADTNTIIEDLDRINLQNGLRTRLFPKYDRRDGSDRQRTRFTSIPLRFEDGWQALPRASLIRRVADGGVVYIELEYEDVDIRNLVQVGALISFNNIVAKAKTVTPIIIRLENVGFQPIDEQLNNSNVYAYVNNYISAKNSRTSDNVLLYDTNDYFVELPFKVLKNAYPLFVHRNGVRVEIELENPHVALCKELYAPFDNVDYLLPELTLELQEVVYRGIFESPSKQIFDDYMRRYNSEEGIVYYIRNWRLIDVYGQSGESSNLLTVSAGLRSVRKCIVVARDTTQFEENDHSSSVNNSLTKFNQAYINSYIFRIGSNYYPSKHITSSENGAYINTLWNEEFLENSSYKNIIYYYNDLDGEYYPNLIPDDSDFIMAADFSRDISNNGMLTGANLETMKLELEIIRTKVYNEAYDPDVVGYTNKYMGRPVYTFLLEYDCLIKLNKKKVSWFAHKKSFIIKYV